MKAKLVTEVSYKTSEVVDDMLINLIHCINHMSTTVEFCYELDTSLEPQYFD